MVERIRGLSIKGRCFNDPVKFKFYVNPNDRAAIVYGKNGSGKSTISDGISQLAKKAVDPEVVATLFDEHENIVELTEDEYLIHVFNENYIDENVKIDDDGLGTIVLLGEMIDTQSEIEKYELISEDARKEVEQAQEELNKYNNKNNVQSPVYHWEKIKVVLKQSGGWAEKDAKIKGSKRNTPVTEDVINEICQIHPNATITELESKYSEINALLGKISDTSIEYPNKIQLIVLPDDFEEEIYNLLSKQIERPTLTDREKLILDAIQKGNNYNVESAKRVFSNPKTKFCPYCYQPVEEDYKTQLLDSINRVLNKDIEDHKAALAEITFPVLNDNYNEFATLDAELVNNIILRINECNKHILTYQNLIKEKMQNAYKPIVTSKGQLDKSVKALNCLLQQLEEKRIAFNDASTKYALLQKELISINKMIAHYHISELVKSYQKQVTEKSNAENLLVQKSQEYQDVNNKLKMLKQNKSDVGLAISNINNALKYVFFNDNRLSIELKNNKYYLKSKGKHVRPKNISVGERNIIALCYFFTQIMNNQEVSNIYKKESFIVIDDPISSFDFENKVGITSFLRYQISRIIYGNPNSKVLIFSHDLATTFDISKALVELCKVTKSRNDINTTSSIAFELSNQELNTFSKTKSEYDELIKRVYKYANGKFDDSLTIGNSMRRLLETFSTFTYKKGIEDVSCDPIVLETLGEHSLYFEALMYRLVLHGESHFEEQVYNLHDGANFFKFISDFEKQRTAKDILCLMYLLNPSHIHSYLNSEKNALLNIRKWVKDLKTNSDFAFENTKPDTSTKRIIKLYDIALSAGTGNYIFDSETPYEDFETENSTCDFALKVSGDSMEPDIPNKSIVLIRKCETLTDGKIGAFFYNGEVYCKIISYEANGVQLVSINSDYKPIIVEDGDTLKLYGEVIEIINQ